MATRSDTACTVAEGTKELGLLMRSRSQKPRDETGASLILALIFLVVIGMLVLVLVSWAGNNMMNTKNFMNARALQYTSAGAVQLDMNTMRHSFTVPTDPTQPPVACNPNGSSPFSLPSSTLQVMVYCSKAFQPSSTDTRVVHFYACQNSATISPSSCSNRPFLEAVIAFDDIPVGSIIDNCKPTSNESCGAGMTIKSWVSR